MSSDMIITISRMLLPEEDFGSQLQHMLSFHTEYPFEISSKSEMQYEGLKLLLANTLGANLEVRSRFRLALQ